MARGQSTAQPIQPGDLDQLRERVATGESPIAYLLVDTALAAAGARVAVLRVDGPEAGDDCVLVRLGDDELPFAPHELSLTRAPRSRQTAATASANGAASARPRVPTGRSRATPVAQMRPPVAAPVTTKPTSPVPTPPQETQPEPPSAPEQPRSPRRAAGRPQPLTVTLRFSGTAWTLEHAAGSRKSIAQPVSPAAVRALADRVDDMALRNTLLTAVEQSRQIAAEHAVALRAQLAAVETVLAEFDD